MRRYVTYGVVSAVLLILFLLLRPQCARFGSPEAPETAGRARELLPEETAGPLATALRKVPGPAVAVGPPLNAVEEQIALFINEERRTRGLSPLLPEGVLGAAARKHSADMIQRGFFDHVNPDGLTPEDRVARENRHSIGTTGENIWSGSRVPTADAVALAREIVASWMASPGHRENILRPQYTHQGIGVVPGGSEVRAAQVLAQIVALTDPDVASSVRSGDVIRLGVAAGMTPCDSVDVFSTETGLIVLGPLPLGDVKMSIQPGPYKLRFYCGTGGIRTIYSGPRIVVR